MRTYPTSTGARLQVIESYQRGILRTVSDYNTPTTVFWTGTSTDAFGHYQHELFGNGIVTISDFDQASGLMASREAGVGGGTGRIDASLSWADLRGNVTERQDLKLAPVVTEAFVNDAISRLDYSTRNGTQNLDLSYDANGNILTKDGQAYVYTGNQAGCSYYAHAQPRAVRKIGSAVYCYDANGNMTKRAGSNITYASYNLPTVINQGSNSSTLSYGAFRNRYKQVAVSGGATETTIYVAGLFEKVTLPSGVIEYRHYIPGGNGTAAIHTRRSTGINSTFYWHADHLGSPELFTDTGATALVRPSFGAFGERRDGTDWLGPPSAAELTTLAGITRRGFTGHEHLDSVGLIHMNGRVYDPGAARFLGVDPIVHVGNSQSPNPYPYVWNNPLALIDPSGLDPGEEAKGRQNKQCIEGQCGPFVSAFGAAMDYLGAMGHLRPDPPRGVPEVSHGSGAGSGATATPAWDGASFGADAVIYGVDSTGGGILTAQATLAQNLPAVVPVFFHSSGNPLNVHVSLADALQAGELAAEAARLASGTANEYGVATLIGHVTSTGVQTYYNSEPVTSNSPLAIKWDLTGLKDLVALNHYHPNNSGFSPEDRSSYYFLKQTRPDFQGIYMYDGRGNHWFGPSRRVWWILRSRTHSCGGAAATTWICPASGPDWRP